MKICTKCFLEKSSLEFGRDIHKKDGLNQYCKLCVRLRSKKQRQDEPKKYKKYADEYRVKNREILRQKAWLTYYVDWDKRNKQAREYYKIRKKEIALQRAMRSRDSDKKEKNRLRQKEWRELNKTKCGKTVTKWKEANPQKAAAHTLVLWSIRTGTLVKPNICSECGEKGKIEGHHKDYCKPLEVIWLCKKCHSTKHRIYR